AASGITAPMITLIARRSRHLVRYREKISTAAPVNINPGCQHKQLSIEQKPAQKGLSLAIINKVTMPNKIIGSFGCVPEMVIRANCVGSNGTTKAIKAASRLRR